MSGPREDPLLPHQAPVVPPPAPPACREALLWPCQNPRLLQNYFCRAAASVTELLGSKQPSLMASCTHTHTHTHIYAHPGTHGHTHNHPVRALGAGGCTLHKPWHSAAHIHAPIHTQTEISACTRTHTQRVASAEFISPSIFTNAANQVALQAEKTHPRHSAVAEHAAKAFVHHS